MVRNVQVEKGVVFTDFFDLRSEVMEKDDLLIYLDTGFMVIL